MTKDMRDSAESQQQQQGTKLDLSQQYQAIGIPALNAVNMYNKSSMKKAKPAPQMGVEFED